MNQEDNPATKKCPFCAEEISYEALKCKHCGEWLNRPPVSQQYSNVQPVWHFVILFIFSFGLYSVYWFYKNWKFLKEHSKLDISPFWRAIFQGIFAYSLFKKILVLAKEKGYTENYSPGFLTILYIIISLLWRLPDPYWLISYFSFVPLLSIVNAINYYWKREQPELEIRKNFSSGDIVLLVIGGIFWIFVLIGIFVPVS